MKITRLETIWLDDQPNTTWVRIYTDDGLVGLGETLYVPHAISALWLSGNCSASIPANHLCLDE